MMKAFNTFTTNSPTHSHFYSPKPPSANFMFTSEADSHHQEHQKTAHFIRDTINKIPSTEMYIFPNQASNTLLTMKKMNQLKITIQKCHCCWVKCLCLQPNGHSTLHRDCLCFKITSQSIFLNWGNKRSASCNNSVNSSTLKICSNTIFWKKKNKMIDKLSMIVELCLKLP